MKDRESRFVTTNRAHLAALGARTLDEIVGKTDSDLFPWELADGYLRDQIQGGLFAGGVPLPVAKVLADQEVHNAAQDARIAALEAKACE